MINAVSATPPVQAIATTNAAKTQSTPAAKPAEDTVHLSPQALAAAKGSGDVDHDGDSH
jgi:hypothetical protein